MSVWPKAQLDRQPYVLTIIADNISPEIVHHLCGTLEARNLKIAGMKQMDDRGFSCMELHVISHGDMDQASIRKELLEIATQHNVDIGLQTEDLYKRTKRLVVLDIDSTLIQAEVIDELAREKGVYDEVAAVTREAMEGKINFDESLKRRCAKLKGLTIDVIEKVLHKLQLTPGANDLIRELRGRDYKIALISGGFTFVAERLKDQLGIDYIYANTLEIKDGVLTGNIIPPIVNARKKADLLEAIARREQIGLDQVVAVGDGANDILMLEKAGLGIAFNAKPVLREKADLSLNQRNMRSILYLLGIKSPETREAT